MMTVTSQVLITVMVVAIAAGVLYLVRQLYQQPAHLNPNGVLSSDYRLMKMQARSLYWTKNYTILAATASVVVVVWFPGFWSLGLIVAMVSVCTGLWSSARLRSIEHKLYDL